MDISKRTRNRRKSNLRNGPISPRKSQQKRVRLLVFCCFLLTAAFSFKKKLANFVPTDSIQNFWEKAKVENIEWVCLTQSNLSSMVDEADLEQLSGLRIGDPILPLELGDIEKKILSSPWIASVQIFKKLPGTVSIHYTPKTAIAVAIKNRRPWFVGETDLIAPVDNVSLDLPVVDATGDFSEQIAWMVGLKNFRIHEIKQDPDSVQILAELKGSQRKFEIIAPTQITQEKRAGIIRRLMKVVQYSRRNSLYNGDFIFEAIKRIDLRLGKKVVVNVAKYP